MARKTRISNASAWPYNTVSRPPEAAASAEMPGFSRSAQRAARFVGAGCRKRARCARLPRGSSSALLMISLENPARRVSRLDSVRTVTELTRGSGVATPRTISGREHVWASRPDDNMRPWDALGPRCCHGRRRASRINTPL